MVALSPSEYICACLCLCVYFVCVCSSHAFRLLSWHPSPLIPLHMLAWFWSGVCVCCVRFCSRCACFLLLCEFLILLCVVSRLVCHVYFLFVYLHLCVFSVLLAAFSSVCVCCISYCLCSLHVFLFVFAVLAVRARVLFFDIQPSHLAILPQLRPTAPLVSISFYVIVPTRCHQFQPRPTPSRRLLASAILTAAIGSFDGRAANQRECSCKTAVSSFWGPPTNSSRPRLCHLFGLTAQSRP